MTLSMLAPAFLAGLRARLKAVESSANRHRLCQSEQKESIRRRMIQTATLVALSVQELRRFITHLQNPSPDRTTAGHELSLDAVDLATPSSGRSQANALSKTNRSITTVVLEACLKRLLRSRWLHDSGIPRDRRMIRNVDQAASKNLCARWRPL
ncbi:MAG: hypothetical protein ACRECP_08390, partial [Methylocella sp.]